LRVYVAGPYTKGDVAVNVRAAILAGQELIEAGHAPFIPHLSHFQHLLAPGPYEQWIALDLVWLEVCEALIRLPGESVGTDAEVDRARKLGISVYPGVVEFLGRDIYRRRA
jgi:uncharacterized protein DUF4406